MIINRSLWFKNTLKSFDSELLLRIQPDNISKLPKLNLAELLTPGDNVYNSYGISKFILALTGDLDIQLINKTSWFKKVNKVFGVAIPKKNNRKYLFVATSLFPHHWSVHQLIPFFLFYFCLKNNCLY